MLPRTGFLDHDDFRFLRAAAAVAALAVLGAWLARPAAASGWGGTPFGYVLGIAAALLVAVLAWYGVRKRRPPRMADRRRRERRQGAADDGGSQRKRERRRTRAEDTWRYGATLRGWLSAHVWLGVLLVVLCSLHAGFRLGWNVHALAYALVVAVAGSGAFGAFAYVRYPRLITENLGADTPAGLRAKIEELDALAQARALGLPEDVRTAVAAARGTGRVRRFGGAPTDCPAQAAIRRLQALDEQLVAGDRPRQIAGLYALLVRKQRLVARLQTDMRLNARLRAWLWLHGPLSIALLAALFAHVFSVLVYW